MMRKKKTKLSKPVHSVVLGGGVVPTSVYTTLDLFNKPDIIKESIINNRTHNE